MLKRTISIGKKRERVLSLIRIYAADIGHALLVEYM